jgi:uncharacterized secreted protein with C-terminal beta-propeller domain
LCSARLILKHGWTSVGAALGGGTLVEAGAHHPDLRYLRAMRVRAGVVVALSVLLAAPVTDAAAKRPHARHVLKSKKVRLAAFDSCSELVGWARGQALRTDGAEGVPIRALPPAPVAIAPQPATQTKAEGVAAPTAAAPAAPAADDSFSGTNNQEAAVDESDVVKTDGRRAYVVYGDKLLAIDLTSDVPKLLGELKLEGTVQEILLRGSRLLAIGYGPAPQVVPPGPVPEPLVRGGAAVDMIAYPYYAPQVRLTEVDVSDPAAMKVARTLDVDGSYVSARLTGGTARVILNTAPKFAETATGGGTGTSGGGTTVNASPPAAGAPAKAAIAPQVIKDANLNAFVPKTTLHSFVTNRVFERSLVGCQQVRRPVAFSGLDLLTVLTIDLDHGLFNVDRDAVMAGAQVVYASEGSLYVASQRWVPGLDTPGEIPSGMQTEIHRFDTSKAGETSYRSSGRVPGFVLGQYALSEWGGDLRVASTEEPLWMNGAPVRDSESAVTVLRESDGQLNPIGRVSGLGKGERIYAVRFINDVGYLVTFRQIDPLYTLDLSNPAAPRVAGELKIAGYSAYLHPIGDNLLLGVGQDATDQGRRAGSQVSVFDVSDPAAPKRIQQRSLGSAGSSSQAEFDPHAFLWWGPQHLAVLPLQEYSSGTPFTGAVGLRVTKGGIDEIARITHGNDPYPAAIRRSLVAGGRVYTISDRGIASAKLDSLAPIGFLAFPER